MSSLDRSISSPSSPAQAQQLAGASALEKGPLFAGQLRLEGVTWHVAMRQPGLVEVMRVGDKGLEPAGTLRWSGTALQPDPTAAQRVPEQLRKGVQGWLERPLAWGRDIQRERGEQGLSAAMWALAAKGVHPRTLGDSRFAHSLDADEHGKLRVPAYTITGRAADAAGADGVWASAARPTDKRLVLTTSLTEAASYHQLYPDPNTRYVAIGAAGPDGAMTRAQRQAVAMAIASMPYGSTIAGAFGYEPLGLQRLKELRELAPHADLQRHLPPVERTWNGMVQRFEQDLIKAQTRPTQAQTRGPELALARPGAAAGGLER